MLRVEHEWEPRRDGIMGAYTGVPAGLAHYVRVPNRGRHPTEIDRVWLSAPGPDVEYVRHVVDLAGAIDLKVASLDGSTTRKVSLGGTWKCRIDEDLARKVDVEFAPVYIIVRDVVTGTEWRGRFHTEMDRKQEARARAQR